MRHFFLGSAMALATAVLSGCGNTTDAGTSTGNGVTLKSAVYSDSRAVTQFKFCSTKIKLKAADGSAVKKEGAESIEAVLGLIDVSTATQEKTWGTLDIPVDFSLGEISVEIHKDKDKCSGAEYSVAFNSSEITKDLEFKFAFSPAIELKKRDTLKLGLDAIAAALKRAKDAGKFNNEEISNYLQSTTKGTGQKGS